MSYAWAFGLAFVISLSLVPAVRKLAFRIGAVDQPVPNSRKIHTRVMPRAGGLVLYTSFVVTSLLFASHTSVAFWGLLGAATIVMLVGLADDLHSLSPWLKLAVQVIAALTAMAAGIKITALTSFSGGTWNFYQTGSVALSILAASLSLLWLVGVTNTLNFLDGLDGLATGVAGIAATIMFILSIGPRVDQPQTALLAIILAGSCFGFLWHNFHPARIFNGDSGAYFLGMTLACLAIISGAKLATALLVLGLPVLDAAWAVMRRTLSGRSPFSADREHLHFLLIDSGLSQRKAVLIIYAFSIAFGIVALISGTFLKLIALITLVLLAALLLSFLHYKRPARETAAKKVRFGFKRSESD